MQGWKGGDGTGERRIRGTLLGTGACVYARAYRCLRAKVCKQAEGRGRERAPRLGLLLLALKAEALPAPYFEQRASFQPGPSGWVKDR